MSKEEGDSYGPFHDLVGATYAVLLICLMAFWPSISLIVLVSLHGLVAFVLLVCLSQTSDKTKDSLSRTLLEPLGLHDCRADKKGYAMPVLRCLGWHLQSRYTLHTLVALIHAVVLLLNLGAFLAEVHNTSPPSSVLVPSQARADHTRFGIVPEGGFSTLDDHSGLQLLQLAQKGYYYAEEYHGDIGGVDGKRCDGTGGIRCYAVGVRHFINGRSSVFQPLPTPAYDVDVQVAVSMAVDRNPATGSCSTLEPIYLQQVIVDGADQSKIFRMPMRPLVQLAWDRPSDKQVCPWKEGAEDGHLGCMEKQRQTEAEYRDALRLHCSRPDTVREEHDEHGAKNHYQASYMRVSANTPTIDPLTGGVVHTILVMKNADAGRPPLLRVTPKRIATGLALRHVFTPVGRVNWIRGEDATTFAKEERPPGQHTELVFGQHYGDHAPLPALRAISIPADYLRSNYPRVFALYLVFFTALLLVLWYYCVTKNAMFGKSSFPTTALLVRVPLLCAGFFVGSVFYAIAQACIIVAYTFVISPSTRGPDTVLYAILLGGVVFNCLHAGFWIGQVANHAHLMAFTRYAAEASTGQIMSEGWSSNLIAPLLVFFLSIEPIVTAVLHTMVMAAVWFRGPMER